MTIATVRPDPVCDYSMAMEPFRDLLAQLAAHLREHNMTTTAEEDALEAEAAVIMLDHIKIDGGWDGDLWDGTWDFIRDNMRKWWD